ncbi:MAG: ThuA domain-containing protein [Rhodothermaceae bacterium]|nr:ThuA domain-containing protein [Rhodothermaceae bacterium]
MRRTPISAQPYVVVACGVLVCFLFSALSFMPEDQHPSTFRALVFSKTSAFRHASIEQGLTQLRAIALADGFSLDATEDARVFNDSTLAQYQVVIFLNTTGNVLNAEQQEAFERYIRSGNGFVGIHSAADTEYDWPFYGNLVGAYFQSHPAVQPGVITVADRVHPSTSHLPLRWNRSDEWYNYTDNPRGDVHVLATLEESSFQGGSMGIDHPIAWCHNYEGGRSWYTGLGHTSETFEEPLFQEHLLQGIKYAAGVIDGDCTATVDAFFEKAVLDANTTNPMHLDIAPDGRVFFVEREGALKIYDPEQQATTTAGNLDVTTEFEDGLLGIVLDPDFEENNWLYLFYSPDIPEAKQHVSRFTMDGSALDLESEIILLEIPVQRVQCCHSGGALTFDGDGNLFIATGDNTNPFESDGYGPIDERQGRSPWDAQGTSANTNDFRGKILRITPQDDGSYIIPEGNLFADSTEGKPEIYIMGVRNPFRIGVDTRRGWLYWGDVGPDAGVTASNRGSVGYDEFNQARSAGNYGWPYCVGDNQAYVDYDFQTRQSGALFNCQAPVNTSPNNTGATNLPPAQPAWIWYPYAPSVDFPQIPDGGGRTAMGGPIYYYDVDLDSKRKLPEYFDDTVFIYEWARNWVLEVKLDENGDILLINPFITDIQLERPIAMELGPDGALYVLEWGTGFGGNNNNSQLVRIEFARGNRSPIASLEASPRFGQPPLTVQFSSDGSFDPDPGDLLSFAWDFDGDGTTDSSDPNPSFTYNEIGGFTASLQVSDQEGNQATVSTVISVGNTPPRVTMNAPFDGGFFDWGDLVSYEFEVIDAEDGNSSDGSLDCANTVFQPFVGHDDHAHPLDQFNACDGTFAIIDAHGSDGDNLFYVVEATYEDAGFGTGPGLSSTARHILRPKRVQAEHFTTNNGTMIEQTGDVLGGRQNVGFIEDGDHFSFDPINLAGINFITYRVASAGPGGVIRVHVDAPDGPVISTTSVERTGQWQLYRDVTAYIEDPGGTHELFFVFTNSPGASGLFNINWMDFIGPGIARTANDQPGLYAQYFPNTTFSGTPQTRVDPRINFNWGSFSPVPTNNADEFSVRWRGFIEPETTDSYTFIATSGSDMNVWIDNQLILQQRNTATNLEATSSAITLEAEQSYAIQVDYIHNGGPAQADLFWNSTSSGRTIVPMDVLAPDSTLSVQNAMEIPDEPTISSMYPNPVQDRATLIFSLPLPGQGRVEVYDLLGRKRKTLINGNLSAGINRVEFDVTDLAAGTYFYVVESSNNTLHDSFVVLK